MTEIFPVEPPPPKRRPVHDPIVKAALWLKSRRSSQAVGRAIAANQVATAALAASVAATGVGGYATIQAHQAQNATGRAERDIARLDTGFANLAHALAETRSNVANLLYRTAELETKGPIQLRALGFRTSSIARELSQLADQVAAMPSNDAQTAALAADVARAASQAHRAMRKAEKAATAAAEADHDEFARAAASQAAVDAGLAAQQAAEAQRVAENAQRDADAAQPFPRTITMDDVSTTQVAGPTQRTFTIDVPRGTYGVLLSADIDCGASPWYLQIASPGMTPGRVNGEGAGHVEVGRTLKTGGGTATFTLSMDATVNLGGAAAWRNITIVFSQESS